MAKGKSRDKSKEALWRKTVREQHRSGLSVREFCRRRKLRETAFYFWRRELVRRDAAERGITTFLPVRIAASPTRKVILHAPSADRPKSGPGLLQRAGAAGREQPPQPCGHINILLAGGRQIHVAPPIDKQALADVLAVVEASPC